MGITFALFGVLLTYYASAQTLGADAGLTWTTLIAHAGQLDPGLMKLAFVFALVGFGTKAGFAPLHNWLPDAHSQAPSPVSAVLSGVLLKCGLYGVIRFYLITSVAVPGDFAPNLLLGFGLLSVVVAVPFILVQSDFKRLLAYHSVEHIGLIATAIGLGVRWVSTPGCCTCSTTPWPRRYSSSSRATSPNATAPRRCPALETRSR